MAGQSVRLAERGLLDPAQMVERRAQAVDLAAAAIDSGIDRRLSNAALRLANSAGRLRPPERRLAEVGAALADIGGRMGQIIDHTRSVFVPRHWNRRGGCLMRIHSNGFWIVALRWLRVQTASR